MRNWIRLGSIQDGFNFLIENKSFSEFKRQIYEHVFSASLQIELIIRLVLF